jgi:hypothetical protein
MHRREAVLQTGKSINNSSAIVWPNCNMPLKLVRMLCVTTP